VLRVTDRGHLLRLELAVCALGATILLTMLAVGIDALRFHGDEWPALAVVIFEGVVLALAVGPFARQGLRQRAFARRLPTRPATVFGTPVLLVRSRRPHAFTLGFLRPRIVISDGLIDLLDEPELRSVLAHERHHAHRRDPLRRALVRAVCDGFWFLPSMRSTPRVHAAISELAADAVAIRSAGAQPLAAALVVFEDHGAAGAGATPERVRHLFGDLGRPVSALALLAAAAIPLATLYLLHTVPPEWCLPLSTALGALVCVPAGLLSRSAQLALRGL
jgi:Peptidase family M48